MSLSQLATEAGVGKSTVSALEQGQGNPTVETLLALVYALDATLADLVEEPGSGPLKVVRADTSASIPDRGLDAVLLHRERQPGGVVETYRMRLPAGTEQIAKAHRAGTREQVFVMTGSAVVGPKDQPLSLATGDLAVYPADVPHVYGSDATGGHQEGDILLTMFMAPR